MPVPGDLRVVTLGTAGGPQWWRSADGAVRAGISTAIVAGDDVYVIDAGYGAGGQLARAGLSMAHVRAVFVTHLHSDHVVDVPGLALFGMYETRGSTRLPIPVVGPGDRGTLPPVSSSATVLPHPVCPDDPTPGVAGLLSGIERAFATDVNDRVLDALRTPPSGLFDAREIAVPDGIGYNANTNPAPAIEPFEVYRDEHVRVTATLVAHPPVAPAFAFRVQTDAASVTVSGDTAPCDNLVRLARGTDLLLHEAIDEGWLHDTYGANPDNARDRAGLAHHLRAHTTPAQAGAIARRAGARALALHHLVPGGLPARRWRDAVTGYDGDVFVPADLDEFAVSAGRVEVVRGR